MLILIFLNSKKEFILETDASLSSLGAVLAKQQDNKTVAPIAYTSHTLQKHKQNYGVTELEALGVVWGVKHFHLYLYEHKCLVITDNEALKSLLNTPHPSGKLMRMPFQACQSKSKTMLQQRTGRPQSTL